MKKSSTESNVIRNKYLLSAREKNNKYSFFYVEYQFQAHIVDLSQSRPLEYESNRKQKDDDDDKHLPWISDYE